MPETFQPAARPQPIVSILTALAGLSALMTAVALPTSTNVQRADAGRLVTEASTARPWAIAAVVVLLAVVALSVAAFIAYRTGRTDAAARLLIPTIVLGLIPAVIPGLLALAARARILRRHTRD